MKIFVFFTVSTLLSTAVFASATKQILTEISYRDATKTHQYTVIKTTGRKPVFNLIFKDGNKKSKTEVLSESQADYFKNEATRIIWSSEYRKPSNVKPCTSYTRIQSGTEKTNVCTENIQANAMTFGLLNSLSRIFH